MSLTGKMPLTTAITINNDGFWPALNVGDLLNNYRIPPEYADNVIKTGLSLAMIRVNEALLTLKTSIIADGFATLAFYTAAHPMDFNGLQLMFVHYQAAVFATAKAWLLQQFNSLNRKPDAENAAKEAPETEQFWLDDAQLSIASLFKSYGGTLSAPGKANFYAVLL